MSNPDDYIVGWVCPVRTVFDAARRLLDEQHEAPKRVSHHDYNEYALGRIGTYNVVIAGCPNRRLHGRECPGYGKCSGREVARQMVLSFRNLRLGMMIGLGGGVPCNGDVRLGDVAVSTPGNDLSGVTEYDFYKSVYYQRLEWVGYLSKPPTYLLSALNGLEARFLGDLSLGQRIDRFLERDPNLQVKYRRPGSDSDRLYKAKVTRPFTHLLTCKQKNTPSLLVPENERHKRRDDQSPKVHYGPILTSEHLMDDASLRDKIAADKHEMVCFDTEMTGFDHHFPHIAIRGICDYSDLYGNDEWHDYAAMAAAVYTKELLLFVGPGQIAGQRKITEHISEQWLLGYKVTSY